MTHFCFKSTNHASNTLNMLENLRSVENFVDVTLACEGQLIKAHKVILSAGSNFFHNILTTNPCKHPVIIMHNVKYSVLKDIIEFMYKGEIYVTHDQLQDLLEMAKTLDVKGLTEIIQDSYSQKIFSSFTALSSTSESLASSFQPPRKKRTFTQNQVSNSASSDNETVSNVKEVLLSVSGETTMCQTSVSTSFSDNSNIVLPSSVIILPRTTKLVNSPSKPVSVPLSEISVPELEVDPSPDHDCNAESSEVVQMSSTSEQSETSSKSATKASQPLIHNITSAELVPVPIIPSNPLTSVVVLEENASDTQSKLEKKRSQLWSFFTQAANEKAKCNLCHSLYSLKGGSTTNLKKHLVKKHRSTYETVIPRPVSGRIVQVVPVSSASATSTEHNRAVESILKTNDDEYLS